MEIRRAVAALVAGGALLAGAVGCGAIAEKASEKVTEKAVESATGCKDIDVKGDGEVSADCGDGNVKFDSSGDADLPEGWPSDLDVPSGIRILATASDESAIGLTGTIEAEPDDVVAEIKGQLEAAGFTLDEDAITDGGNGFGLSVVAEDGEFRAGVIVNGVEGLRTQITYSLTAVGD